MTDFHFWAEYPLKHISSVNIIHTITNISTWIPIKSIYGQLMSVM